MSRNEVRDHVRERARIHHAEGAVAIAQAAEASGSNRSGPWNMWSSLPATNPSTRTPTAGACRGRGRRHPGPARLAGLRGRRDERIRLATGILILAERNPVVTAKEVATLDRLSNGRVTLGVGVGWMREEFEAIGVPFERRGRRLDENIAAMRALWTPGSADLPGRLRVVHERDPPIAPAGLGADRDRRPHRCCRARRAGAWATASSRPKATSNTSSP